MRAIYLDHAAATAQRPEVVRATEPYLTEQFGNPGSTHAWGRSARAALEEARERLAAVIGANRSEVVFTAGGTAAANLAVLGAWRAARGAGHAGSVICSAVEHRAVLNAAAQAEKEGAARLECPVDGDGMVELDTLAAALSSSPRIVSVMWANNEVGTIQPVAEIAELCRSAGVTFHSDAVQALGREAISLRDTGCDLLSISGHKIGGPRGIGALFVRNGTVVDPLLHGGGQERGLWPGTPDVGSAVGFAVAAELAEDERVHEAERLSGLCKMLESALSRHVPGLVINGAGAARLPHILNVSVPETDQEALLLSLDLAGLAVSGGSACQSGGLEPSHVLQAMGRGARETGASIRLSLGRSTTLADIEEAVRRFPEVVEQLRAAAGG